MHESAPRPRIRRSRIILVAVIGVLLLLAAIHFAINGIPSLAFLNPHA